ncbi:PREDICTED: uncharacterized protein LOC109581636 [Amphimedon queenslandica]|uniref:Uncharacterized protein n=2 Tax=Amphimedon queenslandica TaxID=400682 RepID=A0AAN0J402_AMPQE|nr:PREDICTED: uncharacterized protein LOC109581636 [Amphimedon queenslandica]|eukprot:XP_019851482.1 PREDICTED: uncharacterized protein LOC109581636 [Amphimedon queenslandica]
MSPSFCSSFVSLLFLLLNATVQCNTCGTEGFMELSLLEAKTTNNLQTTGLAESVETRWIITEGDKKIRCSADNSKLTEILVGVDVRTVTGNRNQYPRVEIWADESRYRNTVSVELRLSPQNFTTSGLYRITLPISLRIEKANTGYRLGVFQPADDKSVVRFYKVTRAGQIARVVEVNYNYVSKVSDDGEIALQTSSILIYPITSSNCNYPSIDSSFNTNSLSVTSVIPVSDTRAFPDIQFTCNGIVTKWIIGITQNQDTNKHYPNIYLKRSSELIHALTVDASAATSSNGNVYNFTSDIEVQYGDILVINVTTNSNPMYYQQYNGPLNYQLDSSNGLMPLEHNDYPLISVVVVTPSTQLIKTNTIILTGTSASNSTRIPSPTTSSTSSMATSTITIESTASTRITTSLNISTSPVMSTSVSTPESTVSNTLILAGAISSFTILFILLVASILIVSVLVCRRRWNKATNRNHDISANKCTTDQHSRDTQMDNILSNISANSAYGITGRKDNCNTDVSMNPAYGMNTGRRHESIEEIYDEPKTMTDTDKIQDYMIINEAYQQVKEERIYEN